MNYAMDLISGKTMQNSKPLHAKELITESLSAGVPLSVTFKECEWYDPPMYAMQIKSHLDLQVWPGLNRDCGSLIQALKNGLGDKEVALEKVSDYEYTIKNKAQ